jgi:hypothetical protein
VWLTSLSRHLVEQSLDIPASLVDEKLMLTAYVYNIEYNTRPNSLLFLFNQHTRLTLSAV